MAYCPRCRMGTFDAQGLCVLCGAPAQPPTGRRRLAEAVGGALTALLSPAILLAALGAAVLVVAVVATQHGAPLPPVGPRFGLTNPGAFLAQGRTDPGGAAVRLLLPAIVQALLFALLLLVVLTLWRRRRQPEPPPERQTS